MILESVCLKRAPFSSVPWRTSDRHNHWQFIFSQHRILLIERLFCTCVSEYGKCRFVCSLFFFFERLICTLLLPTHIHMSLTADSQKGYESSLSGSETCECVGWMYVHDKLKEKHVRFVVNTFKRKSFVIKNYSTCKARILLNKALPSVYNVYLKILKFKCYNRTHIFALFLII